jgi:molybdate transport system ATP-binding protein
MKHLGIYIPNEADQNKIIKDIFDNTFLKDMVDLSGLYGELISTKTIEKYIEEELKHDRFLVTTEKNNSLGSMSSGQQRKALLTYIIKQQPQFIILDDIFGSTDKATQDFTINMLQQIAASTLLIQLFYRKSDVLKCIDTVIVVDKQHRILTVLPAADFNQTQSTIEPHKKIVLPDLYGNTKLSINPLVTFNNVSVQYDNRTILKDICWTIQSGEFWQLTGPIGSGKSTLLSMITGDNPKAYGQDLTLFGRKKGSGETVWEIKKQIGYFTPTMTAQYSRNDTVENMLISGLIDSVGLYIVPTDLQKRTAHAWMQLLGHSFQHKRFDQLSFGQQRILMVTRAMIKHPPLLILDEPTVGLDDENTALFVSMINAIALHRKLAIIYVSHRMELNLTPDKIFELKTTEEGSIGRFCD